MNRTFSVLQLTTYIRDLFELDPTLQDVWVEGEVSRLTRAASGHMYFTLKDAKSEIQCVMWRSNAARLRFVPQHGAQVLAHGRVTVYEPRGQYQLVCDTLQAAGAGDLHRQFEQLKARLEAEGLFDAERKRPIPPFPRVIGVVTSPTAAAFQDIQNVLRRRYPLAEVILSPTLVQGTEAPAQIVAALERLNTHTNADVIIVARGGGSLEDLWCFNDEAVARAVANSRIPVVSGVGHEIDFTLVDFAADLRAPTPSAAAELVTPDGAALREELRARRARMRAALSAQIAEGRQRVETQRRWLARLSPQHAIVTARQRVDDLLGRAGLHTRHNLAQRRANLGALQHRLQTANPRALLRRGYALVRRADGTPVTRVKDAPVGSSVIITLHDGTLGARVQQQNTQTRSKA